MCERTINSDLDLKEGLRYLSENDARLSQAIEYKSKISLTKRSTGFSALLKTIVSQQLSTAAASKIWQRIIENNLQDKANILLVKDDVLLSMGLSRQKCSYVRALVLEDLDYQSLNSISTELVINRLVRIKGIGKWTAQIYCMFSLARGNIFPSGDLALQEAIRILFQLEKRPTEKEVEAQAQNWAPWKTVAALVLWDFYKRERNRKGVIW